MEIRELPPAEWHRLAELPEWGADFHPDPAEFKILIAEEAGEIVGSWAATRLWHLEGFWIAPSQRKRTFLPVRLMAAMRKFLDGFRVKGALCMVSNPLIGDYCRRLGMTKLPVETYQFEVR